MPGAKTSEHMYTGLQKVVDRARRHPEERILSLAHRIDVPALVRAYRRLRSGAAVGVDGVTKAEYGQDLERKLTDLRERLKSKRWRHQPIRRVHIPKGEGRTRPIGISTVEDKIVQDSIREVLEEIYEQDFLDCSYGFRSGRSAHDALRALSRAVHRGGVQWVIEADIVSFFDSLDRTKLMEMLRTRVADDSLLRLIGKCLTWACSTARNIPSRIRVQPRGRCSHRSSVTSICTTCWTCGSRARSNRASRAGLT